MFLQIPQDFVVVPMSTITVHWLVSIRVQVEYTSPITITVPTKLLILIASTVLLEMAIIITITIIRDYDYDYSRLSTMLTMKTIVVFLNIIRTLYTY